MGFTCAERRKRGHEAVLQRRSDREESNREEAVNRVSISGTASGQSQRLHGTDPALTDLWLLDWECLLSLQKRQLFSSGEPKGIPLAVLAHTPPWIITMDHMTDPRWYQLRFSVPVSHSRIS